MRLDVHDWFLKPLICKVLNCGRNHWEFLESQSNTTDSTSIVVKKYKTLILQPRLLICFFWMLCYATNICNETNRNFCYWIQVFALLLRPNKDHKTRFYWNLYHWGIGYATIIISIVNIFKGFSALEVSAGDRYDNWKHAYIGIIAALGGIAVFLEAYTWIIVIKRKKSENKFSQGVNGTNGVNGYGSRPQQV